MTRLFAGLIAVVLAMFSANSFAALSSIDHPAFGQGSITRDSGHSLDWLTPVATKGLSFLDVQGLLQSDLRFAGFRVASNQELQSLFAAAAIPDINDPGNSAYYGTVANVPGVVLLQSLTGVTYSLCCSLFETAGYLGDPHYSSPGGTLMVKIGNVVLRTNVTSTQGPISFASAFTDWGGASVNATYEGVGTWLVTSVPEPESYALMLAGVGLMGVVARRRKSEEAGV